MGRPSSLACILATDKGYSLAVDDHELHQGMYMILTLMSSVN